MKNNRRSFIKQGTWLASGAMGLIHLPSCSTANASASSSAADAMATKAGRMEKEPWFNISLAQWSLNKAIFGGELDHLDFAARAKSYDIHAIEYVNQFFKDKAEDSEAVLVT